jgi:hypothetical protein
MTDRLPEDQFDEMARVALDAVAVARVCGDALERIALLQDTAPLAAEIAVAALREAKRATAGLPKVRMASYDGTLGVPASLFVDVIGGRAPYDWDRALGEGRN